MSRKKLKAKTIVIDPGHGGAHLGAVGLNGLQEKIVNFRVAYFLKTMLEEQGAKVVLTRNGDETLSLDRRVEISQDSRADLFLSIHHNANAQIDRTINRIEVYYPWNEESPSLDLAQLILDSLCKHLKLPHLPPLPAKYRVLRENVEPSVLGEASYISNPESEKKLASKEYNELEARAYFEAILNYFDRGIPQIKEFSFYNNTIYAKLIDEKAAIDPDTIKLFVDDKIVHHWYESKTGILTAPIEPKNGKHIAKLYARNLAGNMTKPATLEFSIDSPPAKIDADYFPKALPSTGAATIAIKATVKDTNDNPVADNKRVNFYTDYGKLAKATCFTKDGVAENYLTLDEQNREANLQITCCKAKTNLRIRPRKATASMLTGRVINKSNGSWVEGALINIGNSLSLKSTKAGRYYFADIDEGTTMISVSRRGFYKKEISVSIPKATSVNLDIELNPLFDGILLNKKIIVDPEPGYLPNFIVCQQLRNYLWQAGANVLTTHSEPYADVSEIMRTKFVIKHNPDRLISIAHENPYQKEDGCRCYYYYTDMASKAFAERINNHIVNYLGRPNLGIAEWSSYLIIHPTTTRCLVVPGLCSNHEFARQLSTSAYQMKEAYAIFCATLVDLGLNSDNYGALKGKVIDEEGKPIPNALVWTANEIKLKTDEKGQFHFLYVKPGTQKVYALRKSVTEVEVPIEKKKESFIEIRLSC